jgi:hypothetical protein
MRPFNSSCNLRSRCIGTHRTHAYGDARYLFKHLETIRTISNQPPIVGRLQRAPKQTNAGQTKHIRDASHR